MKYSQYPAVATQSAVSHLTRTIYKRFVQTLGVLALAALLFAGGTQMALASASTTVAICLYTQSGTIDVTATYSYYENHVFDPDGFLVGTVNTANQILDGNGQAVGYIGPGSP